MLGQTVREARIRKGLTQAKLARLAGVSRRHLAALEKGANVSVNVLTRVAAVLDLREIQLGKVAIMPGGPEQPTVNLPLLAETIREARANALRVENLIASAEQVLDESEPRSTSRSTAGARFPRLLPRRVPGGTTAALGRVADAAGMTRVAVTAELRQGETPNEEVNDTVLIPTALIEHDERVYRIRGEQLRDHGIEDGDLVVAELRTTGRAANGELVIARVGTATYIGRWWNKHGQKALMSDGLSEVTTGASTRALKVVAAVNTIVREDPVS